ncbi:hypothetical protein BDZ97DRAFT_721069 [Flammula alnicola]|nr:hypothetical protein BDZ97DRAFT_721069 [Flammula alnicola]
MCSTGNPSIIGIGIRVSVYTQALIAPIALYAQYWKYGELNHPDVIVSIFDDIAEKIFLLGAGLLTTAIIHAKSIEGLTPLQVFLVLNLGWIINTTLLLLHIATYPLQWKGPCPGSDRQRREAERIQQLRGYWNILPCGFTVHSLFMSAFGLWFWLNPSAFDQNLSSTLVDGPNCDPLTYYWIKRIPLHTSSLRKFSLAIYSISVIPGVSLVFHALVALAIPTGIAITVMFAVPDWHQRQFKYVIHAIVLFCFMAQPIYFTASTESTIAANTVLSGAEIGKDWTLGDTLAILLALTSVWSMATSTRDHGEEKKANSEQECMRRTSQIRV